MIFWDSKCQKNASSWIIQFLFLFGRFPDDWTTCKGPGRNLMVISPWKPWRNHVIDIYHTRCEILGGVFNPFEQYWSKWIKTPRFGVKIKTILKPPAKIVLIFPDVEDFHYCIVGFRGSWYLVNLWLGYNRNSKLSSFSKVSVFPIRFCWSIFPKRFPTCSRCINPHEAQ